MIVKCIKEVRILDKRIFLKDELYDTEKLPYAIANLPFSINFDDREYFEEYHRKFKDYQAVSYHDRSKKCLRYGKVTDFKFNGRGIYTVRFEDGHDEFLSSTDLTPVETYFFINSEGKIHFQYEGKNPSRDRFCAIINNRFSTQAEAEKYLHSLYQNKKTETK